MCFDGGAGYDEVLGYFGVGEASGDELQDFDFAFGQFRESW